MPFRPFSIALVVGFNDGLARACARRLEASGYVVVRVAHGLAAQDEAARLRAALIVRSRDLFSMEKTAIDRAAEALDACVVEAATERDLDSIALLRHAS